MIDTRFADLGLLSDWKGLGRRVSTIPGHRFTYNPNITLGKPWLGMTWPDNGLTMGAKSSQEVRACGSKDRKLVSS